MPFGVPELLIILVILLVVLGPKRLPMLGRQLGGGMREFKDSITGKKGEDETDDGDPSPAASPAQLPAPAHADVLDPQPDATRTPVRARDESATRPGE